MPIISAAGLDSAARAAAAVATHCARFLAATFDGGYRPDGARAVGTPVVIEASGISAGYGGALAVAGVSGRFEAGAPTAIVGPNGAGKSTLLNVLAGALAPRAGTVRIEGVPRTALGYLPQASTVDRDYPVSVLEFAALGRWRSFGAFRTPPYALLTEVLASLAAVGLQDAAEARIRDLSIGQFRRVLFARLIVQDARLILLDEPFSALDARTTADLCALLQAWHGQGRTLIAALHDLEQVRALFPRTLLLAREVIAWGETGEVLTQENLARAGMGGGRPEPRPGLLRVVPG